ncbi:MAG: hypothetical protein M1816_007979 [Peltula sp. TS41687]|nr:MAG: hypothetical protein M1816_007979 [Peltula sp. TS41687]
MAYRIGRNTDSESVRGSLNLGTWEWERLQVQVKMACRDIDCTTSWKQIPSRQKSEVFYTLLRLDGLAGREDVADWLVHYHWRKRNIVFQAQRRRYSRRMLLLETTKLHPPSSTMTAGKDDDDDDDDDERQVGVSNNRMACGSPDRRGRLDFILNADEQPVLGG